MRIWSKLLASLALAIVGLLLAFLPLAERSRDFAAPTGQPCTACHIGGYRTADSPRSVAPSRSAAIPAARRRGLAVLIPLSGMVLTSFTNTGSACRPTRSRPTTTPTITSRSTRSALFSAAASASTPAASSSSPTRIFLMRRTSTTPICVHRHDDAVQSTEREWLHVGPTVNNNPAVQDPYNSTFTWGFPYVQSGLAPTPTASPVLASGSDDDSIGYTVYASFKHASISRQGLTRRWPCGAGADCATTWRGRFAGRDALSSSRYRWSWMRSGTCRRALYAV